MAAFNWDSEIKNDGGEFKLLEPGVYPFRVKKLTKDYYNGGKTVPPCPKASLLLHVGYGAEASDVTDGLLLDDSLEWKLCQFFTCIGMRKHGEALRMDWDAVEGKTGWVEIEHRDYIKDGETKKANQVVKYIDPQDAPTPAQAQPKQTQAPASMSW